jgi:hypothetical protein
VCLCKVHKYQQERKRRTSSAYLLADLMAMLSRSPSFWNVELLVVLADAFEEEGRSNRLTTRLGSLALQVGRYQRAVQAYECWKRELDNVKTQQLLGWAQSPVDRTGTLKERLARDDVERARLQIEQRLALHMINRILKPTWWPYLTFVDA